MNSYYAVIKKGKEHDTIFVDALTEFDAREHLYLAGATKIISIQKI